MNAVVVNCSAPQYNLGCAKLADWLRCRGDSVQVFQGDPGIFVFGADLICLSVIFSWHAPLALEIALRSKAHAEIWCGGPAMYALADWWERETGLKSCKGLDWRFERQRGDYRMCFASRGCPVGCWFCVVPLIEGQQFTLDWEFRPAPVLCDNNLSALPADFQDHILYRYQSAGVRLLDANSGFEPHSFTEETYRRWAPILRGPWRFAFDEQEEAPAVEAMMGLLAGESSRRKQVYVLAGNEPVASCYDRAMRVIGWGGEPYCQFFKPLNWLGGPLAFRHDWTQERAWDFCRYFNRRVWRKAHLREYTNRKGEQPSFMEVNL